MKKRIQFFTIAALLDASASASANVLWTGI